MLQRPQRRIISLPMIAALFMIVLSFLIPGSSEISAQEAEMSPEMMAMMAAWQKAATPGEQHAELAKAAGTWSVTVSSWTTPDAEPMVSEGTFHRKMIHDGRVLEERYEGNVMGAPFAGYSLVGFDNVTSKYWTIWTDNMSTGPMMMWGAWDEKEEAIVYMGTTPDPMSGTLIDMKSVTRRPSDDHEIAVMYDLSSGQAVKTMEIVSKRQ